MRRRDRVARHRAGATAATIAVGARTATLRVFGEQRHAREGFRAIAAGVLLDVRVRLQMSAQIRAIGKGAMTMLAAERLLARVCAYVALQQPGT